ncbi:MAG: helix-turn-helix transcriptional regulator [Chloroflexi bacterium]|nr:helix-turn-helix transcriptional regulator [Chloroflexota bacterium]
MTLQLLTTKLYIPSPRPELVPRPRLIEQLEGGLRHKLTLISAPAGFGKTTLLSEWISCRSAVTAPLPIAWLSLDKEDNDETRFWTYLIAAIQTVHADLGQSVQEMLKTPQPPPAQSILTPLLNDIAALSDTLVLILDDYHVISNRAIHKGLAFLLEHQPEQLHLILSTRADPPLSVSRLRARGQLTEMRVNDLRFTSDEAATFLNEAMSLRLAVKDVKALKARTEGWVVGLQLAALSMQGRQDTHEFVAAFTGGHHYVLEYLTEEVVYRQSESVQQFLLETSILDRLSGALCDAVTQRDNGDAMLERLRRDNLFVVPLDDEHHWYRYHHLFTDLLNNLQRKKSSPEHIAELHRRASKWYEQNGTPSDAIKHALHAQDLKRAASLMEQAIKTTLSRGSVTTLVRWAEALPEEIVRTQPRLRMYQGWAMFINARGPLAQEILQDVKEIVQAMPPSREKDGLRGELGAMLATIASVLQEIPQAIEEAQEALTYLPEEDLISRARANRALGVSYGATGDTNKAIQKFAEAKGLALAAGNHFLAAEIISQSAIGQAHQGRLRQAAQSYQEIIDLVAPPSRFPPAGLGYIGLADILLEWNDLNVVEDCLDKGIALCQQGGIGYNLHSAYFTRAILKQALGDAAGALEAIHQAEHLCPIEALLERAVHLVSYQVRLQLLRGDVQTAHRWATGKIVPNLSFENLPIFLHELQQVALARVYLARDEPKKVLAIYNQICAPAQAAGRMARVIEISLIKALSLQAQGKPNAARAPFEQCLTLAEPGGYVRLFLEAGDPVVTLLQQAASHGITPNYVDRLLDEFDTKKAPLLPHPAALIDPLTKREIQVLQLICAGCSNQQISEKLVVTMNTVKKHTSNIYAKLSVKSRTQAVARARQLGLY